MLRRRIIPCLDVRDGRVVKGIRFSNLRDAGDPAQCAHRYETQGADELVMLDVSATPDQRATAVETVERIRSVLSIPLTVGGGVRKPEDAEALLRAGADKVGVNTAAVDRPQILSELASRVGAQCVVIAIDAACRINTASNGSAAINSNVSPGRETGWEVVTRSGTNRTGLDAVEWAVKAQEMGAGEILLTSWDRDGSRSGYDLELITTITRAVHIPVIASGGASSAAHMLDAFNAGADAVLAASIFHDADETVESVKRVLAGAGVSIR